MTTFITIDNKIGEKGEIDQQGVKLYGLERADYEHYPKILWWDLHVSPEAYRMPSQDGQIKWISAPTNRKAEKIVSIGANESLIIQTVEKVGTDSKTTGLIVGSASVSLSGLAITSGKIDPNFKPQPIILCVQNVTHKTIYLKKGQKIASLIFTNIEHEMKGDAPKGHAIAPEDILPQRGDRLKLAAHLRFRKYRNITFFGILFYFFVIYSESYVVSKTDKLLDAISKIRIEFGSEEDQ